MTRPHISYSIHVLFANITYLSNVLVFVFLALEDRGSGGSPPNFGKSGHLFGQKTPYLFH